MNIKQMLGIRIAELRKIKGITQEQLAGKMEISPKYLSSIERGKENPTLNTLISLSESLGINFEDLFRFIQIENHSKRKSLVTSLVNKADGDQLKLAYKILSSIIH
jgi:transcriptional regulator with XRE-family HTH domain